MLPKKKLCLHLLVHKGNMSTKKLVRINKKDNKKL